MRTAAWAVPAVAVAVSVPAASASPFEVGRYTLSGFCGDFVELAGFRLAADPRAPLPVGSIITIFGDPLVGAWSVSGGAFADVLPVDQSTCRIQLLTTLGAGQMVAFHSNRRTDTTFQLTAELTLPSGYTADPGAQTRGVVNSTTSTCWAV